MIADGGRKTTEEKRGSDRVQESGNRRQGSGDRRQEIRGPKTEAGTTACRTFTYYIKIGPENYVERKNFAAQTTAEP